MNETLILIAIFVAVLIASFALINALIQRKDVQRNIDDTRRRKRSDTEIDELLGTGNERLRYYLDVVQNGHKDSLKMRLVQAGYLSRSAIAKFNLLRLSASFSVFLVLPFFKLRCVSGKSQ